MEPSQPPPSSMKGLLWLVLILVGVALVLAFLLGDVWMQWFPKD